MREFTQAEELMSGLNKFGENIICNSETRVCFEKKSGDEVDEIFYAIFRILSSARILKCF